MPRTIPPDGKGTQIKADSQAPQLKLEEFPMVVLWQADYPDGFRGRGVCLVHSQSALDGLFRMLRYEHLALKAQTNLKLMPCDDLSVEPYAVRACRIPEHNRLGIPQHEFCFECGQPTRLSRVVEEA
jgi:hypothetical protein